MTFTTIIRRRAQPAITIPKQRAATPVAANRTRAILHLKTAEATPAGHQPG